MSRQEEALTIAIILIAIIRTQLITLIAVAVRLVMSKNRIIIIIIIGGIISLRAGPKAVLLILC